MTDYADAKTKLEAAILSAKTFLATQDASATLQTTFAPLVTIKDRTNEWIRALIALETLNAATDNAIANGLTISKIADLRKDAQRLQDLGTEIKDLVVLIAGKAEQP